MIEPNVPQNLTGDQLGDLPVQELAITSSCDLQCVFCSQGRSTRFFMQSSEWRERLKYLSERTDSIRITGGEPTTHPDLSVIICYARSLGVRRISIESNGRNLGDIKMVEGLIDAGADFFLVSLHGHNEAVHDGLTRVAGSFADTVRGIENIVRRKCNLLVNVVINSFNLQCLDDIAIFLESKGVKRKLFSLVDATGEIFFGDYSLLPSWDELRQGISRMPKNISYRFQHIPLCILGEQAGRSVWIMDRKEQMKYKSMDSAPFLVDIKRFIKADNCQLCRFNPVCYGVDSTCASFNGWKQINPVEGDICLSRSHFFCEFSKKI